MEPTVSSHIETYPTFVTAVPGGGVTKYNGARTPDALRAAIMAREEPVKSMWEQEAEKNTAEDKDVQPMSAWESGDSDTSVVARKIALDTGTRLVTTTMEADSFIRRNNGVLVLVSDDSHVKQVKQLTGHNLKQTGNTIPVAVGEIHVLANGMTDELRRKHGKNKLGFLVAFAGDSVIYTDSADQAINHLRQRHLLAPRGAV
jgi:ethanolamine utilization microcompartment shell protein EutS